MMPADMDLSCITDVEFREFGQRVWEMTRGVVNVQRLANPETREECITDMLEKTERLLKRLAYSANGNCRREPWSDNQGSLFRLSVPVGGDCTSETMCVNFTFGNTLHETQLRIEYSGNDISIHGTQAVLYGLRWARMHGLIFMRNCIERIEEHVEEPDGLWDPPLPPAEAAPLYLLLERLTTPERPESDDSHLGYREFLMSVRGW